MPVMEGKEALGLILREIYPPPGIVILTMHNQPHLRRELLGMGASAFLAKSASLAEVISAVKGRVRCGRRERTLAKRRRHLRVLREKPSARTS